MLDRITPVILTFNEQENIGRVLKKLSWAKDIVLVDSFSDDNTLRIASGYPRVRVFQRRFDSHANQWNFAISETGIATDWVLALDADYVLSDELLEELKELEPKTATAGYRVGFIYCLKRRALRGGIYPAVTVLYRNDGARYEQDGHTQRVVIDGDVKILSEKIFHDDRKPLSRWFQSQDTYAKLEAQVLAQSSWRNLGYADKVRKLVVVAPFAVFAHCLVLNGGIFDGKVGLYYALQRMLAEIMVSLRLLEFHLTRQHGAR